MLTSRRNYVAFGFAAVLADGALLAAPQPSDAASALTSGESTMQWSSEELSKIVKADDLHIAPFREDGVTYGTPTWIWCVSIDGDLYVRAYNGVNSRWHQAAIREMAGRIVGARMTRDVSFEPVEGPINDRIDDAYRAKYSGSQYLQPMISERSRAATIRIIPRESKQ